MIDISAAPDPSAFACRRVLVFDSGIGGLTVRQELLRQAPGLQVDYAADTGFFPYGDKPDDALRRRLPQLAAHLVALARPDVFVIACNTASTLALSDVRAALAIPVVGTVPAIKPAAAISQSGTIGLLATPGTLARAYTADLIAQFARGVRVLSHGSLDLVYLAERHAAGETPDLEAFRAAQSPLFAQAFGEQIDTVVLACTHFPLVRGALEITAPRPLTYIDSGEAIARQTLRVLSSRPASTAPYQGAARAIVTSPDGIAQLGPALQRYGFSDIFALTAAGAGTGQTSS